MQHTSVLARTGLWRITRHEFVRGLYQRLDRTGVFLAQLDRFEREAQTPVDRSSETLPGDIRFDVHTVTETIPGPLADAPLAPTDRVALAHRDGETVGYCCLSNRPVYVPELHRRLRISGSYLWRLYVTPGERGCGIGSALIAHAIRHTATELDSTTITALVAPDNLPSRKAFQRMGFTPAERFTSIGCGAATWHRQRLLQP